MYQLAPIEKQNYLSDFIPIPSHTSGLVKQIEKECRLITCEIIGGGDEMEDNNIACINLLFLFFTTTPGPYKQ